MLLLSGILKRAVVRGLIPSNPVADVTMPRTPPTRAAQPLAPDTVEEIRQILLAPRARIVAAAAAGQRPRRAYRASCGSPLERQRNALIVSMLAYGGFRPGEGRALRWSDLHQRTMHVYATKTRTERDVDLLAPLGRVPGGDRQAVGDRTERAMSELRERRISEAVEANPGMSKRAIRETVRGKTGAVDLALKLLIAEDYIDAQRDGHAHRHHPIRPYRDADDTPNRDPVTQPCPNRDPDTVESDRDPVTHPLRGDTVTAHNNGHAKPADRVPGPCTCGKPSETFPGHCDMCYLQLTETA